MKKILSFILILAIVFSFAACGKSENNTAKEFTRGTVSGNRYENEFLGLGIELGESWVFYTDEQIATLYGLTTDFLEEDFGEYLKNATIIYDMQAADTESNNNVGINFEKLTELGEVQTTNMETFVSSLMPTLANSLESVGCTDVSFELVEYDIDGKTFYGGKTKADLQGFELYQALICVKCEGYVSNITITSVGEDRIDSILDGFFVVK